MPGPDWKLDRRDSGRLFWRRDSNSNIDADADAATASKTAKERVKFRYDVEVLEFWEAEDHVDEPVGGGELRPMRAKREDKTSPPLAVCLACVAAIVASIWYQWVGARLWTSS